MCLIRTRTKRREGKEKGLNSCRQLILDNNISCIPIYLKTS